MWDTQGTFWRRDNWVEIFKKIRKAQDKMNAKTRGAVGGYGRTSGIRQCWQGGIGDCGSREEKNLLKIT